MIIMIDVFISLIDLSFCLQFVDIKFYFNIVVGIDIIKCVDTHHDKPINGNHFKVLKNQCF